MQAVSDQTACALYKLSVFFSERVQLITLLVHHDLVNADPPIASSDANHLHELLHSFSGAPAGQRKSPDLLQLFASGFLHSRGNNLAQKKPSASTIFNFLR